MLFLNTSMETRSEQVMTLKVKGEACEQLQKMADTEDRTLSAQLNRTIREAFVRFQQGGAA